ncbi:XRE family transcriptional regulator [Exiguobacterium sp. MER 193]|uniref:helix-turn-helix domain-containing protein n=1 Tax=Exiguobacterium sp. MER 193 TaxID=2939564 RepID=UPI00203F8967|nr:XRE family transcriptional regulator [Exiguobacterium sp. MER 193]MCM3280787.1 XRE family transcriptional regulator [Exiguobacterium sp. MER 193]
MTIGDKIRSLRKSQKMSQGDLAKKLDVGTTAVSAWENNKNRPLIDKIILLAEIFNVPVSYFIPDVSYSITDRSDISLKENGSLYGLGKLPPDAITRITASNYKIPVYGSISAGIPLEAIENLTETSVPEHVILKHGEDKLFGLLVRGDSMNKIVHDGHYAILCKTDRVESGEVAAVIVNGYDATLKRVILLDRGVLLEPSSYNPEHTPKMYLDEEAKDIKVIGKLVAVMSPPDFKF